MKLFTIGWRFALLTLIISIIEISLLKIVLQFGFTSDDWWILFDYKIYGRVENFLGKYLIVLNTIGLHHTYQIMYVGLLESFFKGNYPAYHLTSIIFKTLATISIYPLILLVFKQRLLAFLATILFAISYSSAGALLFVCTGSDYLAIFFMNVFLIVYHYFFTAKKGLFLIAAGILLFLSFMLSPIRMFPLLGFVFLIELFIWIRSRKLLSFSGSVIRLIVLMSPLILIWHITRGSSASYLNSISIISHFLSYGNYQLLLSPFAGLGYTFLINDYWSIFGKVTFENFNDYLSFLLHGPIIIYSLLTVLLGFIITKKPMSFILAVIFVNIAFEIICYFLISPVRLTTGPNAKGFQDGTIYAIFLGFFVISVAFAGLILWFKNKSNILLLSLFAGPLFSSVFLWGTWLIKGDVLTFNGGIHWYMVIAAMGSSLFLASLMALAFEKIKFIANSNLRKILITCLFLTILPVYLISSREIDRTFSYLLSIGSGAADQEEMKAKFLSDIKEPPESKPRLFYFETAGQKYYPISLLDGFEERMHFIDWEFVDGCVGLIYDRNKLEKAVMVKNGVKGFNVSSLCVKDSFQAGRMEVFYSPENLYAFELKDREAININEKLLKDLNVN